MSLFKEMLLHVEPFTTCVVAIKALMRSSKVLPTHLATMSALSLSQVLVNSNLGCKVSGFRPLQEDKIEAIYTTLVRVIQKHCFSISPHGCNQQEQQLSDLLNHSFSTYFFRVTAELFLLSF